LQESEALWPEGTVCVAACVSQTGAGGGSVISASGAASRPELTEAPEMQKQEFP
jgi:hypothetical protein